MKTRLLRIVWIASVFWLGFLFFIATFTNAWSNKPLLSDLIPHLIEIGWPAVVGLICCYVLNGEIGWPQYKTIHIEKKPQSSVENSINNPTLKPEEEFLNHIEKSKNALKQSLEDSKNKMLQQWRHESINDLNKVEKIKEVIHKSEVIPSALNIIRKTYHWDSWIPNQEGRWQPDEWIIGRLKFPIESRGQEIQLSDLMPGSWTTYQATYKLETSFGFIDENKKHITLLLYKRDASYDDSYGRLLVKVEGQLMLDIGVYQKEAEYDNWLFSNFESIEFATPDVWFSSVVNLSTEFEGHAEIEKAQAQIKIEKHQISTNLKSQGK